MKYLVIIPTKYAQDLYGEMDEKSKINLNKWRHYMCMDRKTQYSQDQLLPNWSIDSMTCQLKSQAVILWI